MCLSFQLVNLIAIVEQEMNCVERVSEYGRLQPEGPVACPQDPPKAWPYSGSVTFDNVKLRYGDSQDWALGGVSFKVCPGQKVGIVGRTGAGKSSLVSVLFAAHPLSDGKVVVDNICINDLGLETVSRLLTCALTSAAWECRADPSRQRDVCWHSAR